MTLHMFTSNGNFRKRWLAAFRWDIGNSLIHFFINLSPVYTTENFWHGSDEIGTGSKNKGSARIKFAVYTTCPYQILSVPNQNFYPCWDLRRGSPSTGENGTGAEKSGTVRIEQVV